MKHAIVSHPGIIAADILADQGVGVRQFAGSYRGKMNKI